MNVKLFPNNFLFLSKAISKLLCVQNFCVDLSSFVLWSKKNQNSDAGEDEKRQAKEVWNEPERVLYSVSLNVEHQLFVYTDHRSSNFKLTLMFINVPKLPIAESKIMPLAL